MSSVYGYQITDMDSPADPYTNETIAPIAPTGGQSRENRLSSMDALAEELEVCDDETTATGIMTNDHAISASRLANAPTTVSDDMTNLPHSSKRDLRAPSTGLARNATADPRDYRDALEMGIFNGRRVSRDGRVLDHNGDVLGEVVIGDTDRCAGARLNGDGEVCSRDGTVIGRVRVITGDAAHLALDELMRGEHEGPPTESILPPRTKASPESLLSKNAMKAARLALDPEAANPCTWLSLQGQVVQDMELQKMQRKMAALGDQMRSIEHALPVHMHPQLYEKLSFKEITASYNRILSIIAEQRTWRLSDSEAVEKSGEKSVIDVPSPTVVIVNSKEAVSDVVNDILATLADNGSRQFPLDAQGRRLGRDGGISIITIYLSSINRVYLLDVAVLGSAAFKCSGSGSNCSVDLQVILEDPTITKLMHDCRLVSIALHKNSCIKLKGATDLQLTFCATRTKPKDRKHLHTLPRAALHAVALGGKEREKAWKYDLRWGHVCLVLGEPDATNAQIVCEEGGQHWNTVEIMVNEEKKKYGLRQCDARPMPKMVEKYCVARVVLFDPLLEYCTTHPVWNEALAERVQEATEARLRMREWEDFPEDGKWWDAAPAGWPDIEHELKDVP